MAHYKRGYPRTTSSGHHVAEITYRKHHGIEPLRRVRWEDMRCGAEYGTPEYREAWLAYFQIRDEWPSQFNLMRNWPRWWDIFYHNRPRRAQEKAMERKVLSGRVDADEAVWPLSKKPHVYYW